MSRMDPQRRTEPVRGQAREQRREQRQALRERILEVSRGIVRREGFAALSMRRLAEAIEYSPAALYLHFRSRADIAHALCVEGHTQLRGAFLPHASIADPAARLRAMGRAYVDFGFAEPETYRLMFMDTSGKPKGAVADDNAAGPGVAALSLMADAFVELRAARRLRTLPPDAAPLACAQALWANLHGIVALALSGAALSGTPAATLVDLTLDAWFAGILESD